MSVGKLTRRQAALIKEIRHMMSLQGLDLSEIVTQTDPNLLTTELELAKREVVRSTVIHEYVLVDELLSVAVCRIYFGKKRSLQQLWRSKRFQSFNYFILEKLYPLQKLDLVRSVRAIPKWVVSDVAGLNELRNGVAHSYFPENRRRKPDWKGHTVYSSMGYDRFTEDLQNVRRFLHDNFWRGTPEDVHSQPKDEDEQVNGR